GGETGGWGGPRAGVRHAEAVDAVAKGGQRFDRVVGRAVVDDDDFEVAICLREDRLERRRDRPPGVEGRDDDRYLGRTRETASHASPAATRRDRRVEGTAAPVAPNVEMTRAAARRWRVRWRAVETSASR